MLASKHTQYRARLNYRAFYGILRRGLWLMALALTTHLWHVSMDIHLYTHIWIYLTA